MAEPIKISTLLGYVQDEINANPKKFNPNGDEYIDDSEIGTLLQHYKTKDIKSLQCPTEQGNVKFNRELDMYPARDGGENIKFNRRIGQTNTVIFNNGIMVEYPDQAPEQNAEILTSGRDENTVYDNQITLKNMNGATIYTTPQSDLVTLEGCTNSFVDSSRPDMADDLVIIKDGERLSGRNRVTLSGDCADSMPMDWVEINHNSTKRFMSNDKYYCGAKEGRIHLGGDTYYVNDGFKTVNETNLVDLKQAWFDLKSWFNKN